MSRFVRLAMVALSLAVSSGICPAANIVGFLVYTPTTENTNSQTKVIAFSQITWQSADRGLITDSSGATVSFTSTEITKYVYLDAAYYFALNNDASFKPFRQGILDREIILPNQNADIISNKDSQSIILGSQTIDSIIKAAPVYQTILAPLKSTLDDEIARYQSGEVRVSGQWLSAKDYQAQANTPSQANTGTSVATTPDAKTNLPTSGEVWTTEDGKIYRNVIVVGTDDDGVRITCADGAGKIPYYELPLEIQKRFGQDYKTLQAKRDLAQQALEEANRKLNQAAVEQKKLQAQAASAPSPQQLPPGKVDQANARPTDANQPLAAVQPSAKTSAPPVPIAEDSSQPASTYSYNESTGICYLETPPIDLWPKWPETAAKVSTSTHQNTLVFKIGTAGKRPEAADKIEVNYSFVYDVGKFPAKPSVDFLVDGKSVHIDSVEETLKDGLSDGQKVRGQFSFDLSLDQEKILSNATNIDFIFAGDSYAIDRGGISKIKKFFVDVDGLPPVPSFFVRMADNFYDDLPAIMDFISASCVYLVLGAFIIIVLAVFGGVALGMIKIMRP